MRTSRKEINSVFEMLCQALGKKQTQNYNDIGTWSIDHNPYYGGYVIEEVHNEGGGITHPFGETRHSAYEFVTAMRFALRAITLDRKETSWHPSQCYKSNG